MEPEVMHHSKKHIQNGQVKMKTSNLSREIIIVLGSSVKARHSDALSGKLNVYIKTKYLIVKSRTDAIKSKLRVTKQRNQKEIVNDFCPCAIDKYPVQLKRRGKALIDDIELILKDVRLLISSTNWSFLK